MKIAQIEVANSLTSKEKRMLSRNLSKGVSRAKLRLTSLDQESKFMEMKNKSKLISFYKKKYSAIDYEVYLEDPVKRKDDLGTLTAYWVANMEAKREALVTIGRR